MDDWFTFLSGVCSILGLAVSVFTANKVMKISKITKIEHQKDQSKTNNHVKDTVVGGDNVGRDKITGQQN